VAAVVEVATRFRLLLDSNVLFAAEPFAGRLEPGFSPVAELLRIASEQGHAVLIHPASLDDAREDKDLERRRQRLAELGKYACLRETPILPKLAELFGSLRPGSNDARDLRILSALPARAATHLVTDDNRLRRRAARAGFGAAVSTVGDTLALLRDLVRPAAEPPPRVRELLAYEVDGGQSIFASLRLDYPEGNGQVGFDTWLDKVRADPANRKIFAVIIDGAYQAVAILKLEEDDRRYGFPAGTTKIATLKVHDDHGGSKLGELLLKALLSDAHERGAAGLFVEVHPRHKQLIGFLADFGFTDTKQRVSGGQYVLYKSLQPPVNDTSSRGRDDPLTFHIAYGPPAIRVAQAHIVPVQPVWFDQLFPDSSLATPPDLTEPLFGERVTRPCGNALRKVYVSWTVHRRLRSGDLLLFYRSHDTQAVAALGVLEQVLVSADPLQIITFLGQRSVYTPEQITEFCRRGGAVSALLFRQDRLIDPPWPRELLNAAGVVKRWPQTVTTVAEEGVEWLRAQVESP